MYLEAAGVDQDIVNVSCREALRRVPQGSVNIPLKCGRSFGQTEWAYQPFEES